jgi:hypothetical protein
MTPHAIVRVALGRPIALLLGVLMLSSPSRVNAQISPGPLAKAHQALEGATNCVKCHGLNREPMTAMCVACHRDIGVLQREQRGYHGREVRASGKTCAQCHPDHAGASFDMIAWPGGSSSRFDHDQAGWRLDGAHREATCTSCHATAYRVAPVAALSVRKGSAGWIGLGTKCATCHERDDAHRGDLSTTCESCHDAKAWAPAPTFDHEKTDYPLTGAHADVKCAACHETPRLPVRRNAEGERVGTFKPVPFRECSSCHADPHRGALGARCASCHVTRAFDVISRTGFDHQVTKYPLRGKHASVSCAGCHGENLAVKTPPFRTCATCHQDPHDAAVPRADCAACHTVSGFAPSTFTVAQHARTSYPLDGRHVATRCIACHVPVAAAPGTGRRPARAARLALGAPTCASCHADAHGRELAGRVTDATCESCHTTGGFAPSTYTAAAHARLAVSLEGRHGQVPCAACHGPQRPGLPALVVPKGRTAKATLRVPEVTCAGCHVDPHRGKYEATGSRAVATGCPACHDVTRWRPATTTVAQHASLGWALEGGHRAVPCVACHQEMSGRPATATLRLAARGVAELPFPARQDTRCASCHDTPHGAQFAQRKDGGACEGCHEVAAWAPARFDHERQASFTLAGAHAKVACGRCHRAPGPGAPVVYRPLSSRCESCHAGTPDQSSRRTR